MATFKDVLAGLGKGMQLGGQTYLEVDDYNKRAAEDAKRLQLALDSLDLQKNRFDFDKRMAVANQVARVHEGAREHLQRQAEMQAIQDRIDTQEARLNKALDEDVIARQEANKLRVGLAMLGFQKSAGEAMNRLDLKKLEQQNKALQSANNRMLLKDQRQNILNDVLAWASQNPDVLRALGFTFDADEMKNLEAEKLLRVAGALPDVNPEVSGYQISPVKTRSFWPDKEVGEMDNPFVEWLLQYKGLLPQVETKDLKQMSDEEIINANQFPDIKIGK